MLLSLELKTCGALWSVDMVCAKASAGLLGKGPVALIVRCTCLSGDAPAGLRGGLGISTSDLHQVVLC